MPEKHVIMSKKSVYTFLFLSYFLSQYGSLSGQKYWSVFSGYGNYEALHIGTSYNFRNNLSFGTSIGTGIESFSKNDAYYSLTLYYNWIIKRKKNPEPSKWIVESKIIFWYSNDHSYMFKVLSPQPSIGRIFSINKNYFIIIDAGPTFNIVLDYKRKTFVDVGWVNDIVLNITVVLQYKF
jgi:hypothetical protein